MIKLIKSTFYNEADTKEKLVNFIQGAKQLSIGEHVEKFERDFATYQGRKYCVMYNSGSSANLALIQALLNLGRLQKQDVVGFSSLTWVTNVAPLIQLDLQIQPLEVELDNLNVSKRYVEQAHTAKPLKAVFLTNLLGFSADIDQVEQYCADNNIILLEDNCESLGSEIAGKKLGNFSLASTYSTYVGHHMSTIEGGMVCTDDPELDMMLRMVRAHGWDRNLPEANQVQLREQYNVKDSFYARYTFYTLGYNLRPTEINGFLGHVQIQYIDEIVQKREENFKRFMSILEKHPDKFEMLNTDHMDVVSNFAMPIICKNQEVFDHYSKLLLDNDVEIRPVVGGSMIEQPFFKDLNIGDFKELQHAHMIHTLGFYFGNNPELTAEEIDFVLNLFDA